MTKEEEYEREVIEVTSKLYPFLCREPKMLELMPRLRDIIADKRMHRLEELGKLLQEEFVGAGVLLIVVPKFEAQGKEIVAQEHDVMQETLSVSNLHPLAQFNAARGLIKSITDNFSQAIKEQPYIPDRTIN